MKGRHHNQAAEERGPQDCSNYRRIMLPSVAGKVLNRVLLERMKEAVNPNQQAGFHKNISCADQIASLRQTTFINGDHFYIFLYLC